MSEASHEQGHFDICSPTRSDDVERFRVIEGRAQARTSVHHTHRGFPLE
jgi:hypothetical protein